MMTPRPASPEELEIIHHKLGKGAVYRARALSLSFSLAFTLYGVSSLSTIQRFDSTVTLFSNVWPRVLLNGIPYLCLGLYFGDWEKNIALKMWLWAILFPILFTFACLVNVWPIIYDGHPDLYLYVHGANVIVILMGLILVSPPPKFLAITIASLVIFFILPLAFVFNHIGDFFTLKYVMNDFSYAIPLAAMAAYQNYSLRFKLAKEDVRNKHSVQKFVGNLVTDAIFENRDELLKNRSAEGFLLALDVRGFTKLMKSDNQNQARQLMDKYHNLVATFIGGSSGFIHKTHGDGHLISFGLMNEQADLSGIPGLFEEEKVASLRRNKEIVKNAIITCEKIIDAFFRLKNEFGIGQNIQIGAAIDFGVVEMKIKGDARVRLEFDFDGIPVIRCVRLENHTKFLSKTVSPDNSYLILSKSAVNFVENLTEFQKLDTTANPVRDFPEEDIIYYRTFSDFLSEKKVA